MALPTGCVELYRSQRRFRQRQGSLNKVTVQQLFECDSANTAAAEIAFMSSPEGLIATPGTKLSVEVTPRGGKTPGTDLITVAFDYWDLAAFPIGSATVTSISTQATLHERERAGVHFPGGDTVNFGNEPDELGYTYKIINGAFTETLTETVFSVNTGIPRESFSLANISAVAGKINAQAFMGLPAGTVLCVGCRIPRELLVDATAAVVPLSYILSYNPKGWPTTIDVRVYKDIVQMMPQQIYTDGVFTGYVGENTPTTSDPASAKQVAVHRRVPESFDGGVTPYDVTGVPVIDPDSGFFNELQGLVTWWTFNQ